MYSYIVLSPGFSESNAIDSSGIRQQAMEGEYDYDSDSDLDEFESDMLPSETAGPSGEQAKGSLSPLLALPTRGLQTRRGNWYS